MSQQIVNPPAKKRNSSFELVKVIAIVCIVFCHAIPTERIEYHFATSDPWLFGIILFRQLGSVGNAIFMAASAWFLVETDRTDLRKMKRMIADNQVISLVGLALLGGYGLAAGTVVKQVVPFLSSTLWYITCYVLYYCVHGLINRALNASDVKLRPAMAGLILFDLFVFAVGGLYYTVLIGFILVHVFTWCLKKSLAGMDSEKKRRLGRRLLILGILGWLLGAAALNLIGIRVKAVGEKLQVWNSFDNPFILALAFGCMLLASGRSWHSEAVNRMSGLSLYIYMITGNQLLRTYPDNLLYDAVRDRFGPSMAVCFLFVIAYAAVKLAAGSLLAAVYKRTAARGIARITEKECDFLKKRFLREGRT